MVAFLQIATSYVCEEGCAYEARAADKVIRRQSGTVPVPTDRLALLATANLLSILLSSIADDAASISLLDNGVLGAENVFRSGSHCTTSYQYTVRKLKPNPAGHVLLLQMLRKTLWPKRRLIKMRRYLILRY
ncbi:MAG: hypothetical protein ACYC0Z_00935 [Acidobacteriaceae bacterium]